MPPSHDSDNDPVDALLWQGDCHHDQQLHDAVLAQTSAVVRRRCYVRQAGHVAVLATCFLAGAATMQLWRLPTSDAGVPLAHQAEPQPAENAPEPDRADNRPTVAAADQPRPPHELRRAGFKEIRRVSDRFLYEKGDVALATRYYVRALDTASSEQRAISLEEDSWLLMALKASRTEETENDNDS